MKASRLLTLLLLLQTRPRITTGELALRLEVSRRTVLRDVEALSAAGVPVYVERGRHGGVVLLPGARLNAAHLEPAELEALSVAGLDLAQRGQVGLAAAHERASRKIAARRGVPSGGELSLSSLIVVDNTSWLGPPSATVSVAGLALDLRTGRRLRISYRRGGNDRARVMIVDPYGLAAKSGRWYLVADHEHAGRLFNLDRLDSYEVQSGPAATRDGQDLRSVWDQLRRQTETLGHVIVTARLRASRVDLARRILGARLEDVRPADGGWCRANVRYPDLESVRQLLQFGDHIEVLAPAEARQRVRELAADLARRHATADLPPAMI
jgi:predicted DNA-binding transcriptional regulator YafY